MAEQLTRFARTMSRPALAARRVRASSSWPRAFHQSSLGARHLPTLITPSALQIGSYRVTTGRRWWLVHESDSKRKWCCACQTGSDQRLTQTTHTHFFTQESASLRGQYAP